MTDIRIVTHEEYTAIRNRLWPANTPRAVRFVDRRRSKTPLPPAPLKAVVAFEPPAELPALPTEEIDPGLALIRKWGIPAMPPTPRLICAKVCDQYGIEWDAISGPSRRTPIVRARQHLIHDLYVGWPKSSMPGIGRLLGGRDHTTVLHAIRKHAQTCGTPVPNRGHGWR